MIRKNTRNQPKRRIEYKFMMCYIQASTTGNVAYTGLDQRMAAEGLKCLNLAALNTAIVVHIPHVVKTDFT